jgi:hypothetical protein
VGKPDGKRPLGVPRSRWADNIKMDLGEKGWGGGGIHWIGVAYSGQLESSCKCCNKPSGSIKCWEVLCTTGSFSSNDQL